MNFKGFIETSFVDWDGKISSVLFTGGCDFRCPFCYNSSLVLTPEKNDDYPMEVILSFLKEHNDFIDGVVITGGEPTLHGYELVAFCREMKGLGLLVKLDTNGTGPQVIKLLLEENLVDFIAMDFKGPFSRYELYSGVNAPVDKIKESFEIIKNSSIDYEFRTTIVPTLHTNADIEQMAQFIGDENWILQKFQPKLECIDMKLSRVKKHSDERMEEIQQVARKYAKYVRWRGK